MAYQVKSGSLTVVAPSVGEILSLFDRLVEYANGSVFIRDLDGHEINPDELRELRRSATETPTG